MPTHAHGSRLLLALCAAFACGDSHGGSDDTAAFTSLTSASASAASTGSATEDESTATPTTTAAATTHPDTTTITTTASTTDPPDETTATTTTTADDPSEFNRLDDSLRGGTMGSPIGGVFGDSGWTVTDRSDRIYWPVPRLVEGSVEFTVTGVTLDNLSLNDHEIFAMYEGGHGIEHPIKYSPDFRNNSFKMMIRVYGAQEGPDRVGKQKVMWGLCPFGAPGYHDGECPCQNPPGFFDEPFAGDQTWDGTPQRLRVEWKDGLTRYLRNGALVLEIAWGDSGHTFGPEALYISLGDPRPLDVDTAGMPLGAIFSDLAVEGWTGPASATCG